MAMVKLPFSMMTTQTMKNPSACGAIGIVLAIYTHAADAGILISGRYQHTNNDNIFVSVRTDYSNTTKVERPAECGPKLSFANTKGTQTATKGECKITVEDYETANGPIQAKVSTENCPRPSQEKCSLDGIYRHYEYVKLPPLPAPSQQPAVSIPPNTQGASGSGTKQCYTEFSTRQRGVKIIINGEFVGTTGDFPLRVNVTDYAHQGNLTNTGKCTADTSLLIKALPPGSGCVNVESVNRYQKIPSRMYFDTNLCPQNNVMDVYVN